MKSKLMLFSLLLAAAAGTGYASWTFSGNSATINSIAVNIGKQWSFNWTDSDVLDDETYEYSAEFPDALNGLEDPDSETGQALAAALAARKSTDWVGNIDEISSVNKNLAKVLNVSDDCTYIIKIKADGSYELYVTYVTLPTGSSLRRKIGQRFGTVYKTVYQQDASGKYKAVQSYKGTATYTYYDSANNQYQASFNTDDFQAN